MASTQEDAMQGRLDRAETGWRREYAAHDRTLDELHVVSRALRDASGRIETLEMERDDRRADVGELEEQSRRAEEEVRRKEAEWKERDAQQLVIINQLRAEIDEGASTLQSVLEHQNDIRGERDAAVKRLEGIQANDREMRELREQVASRILKAEEEVQLERAKATAAEAMREISIREIKALNDAALEAAAKHAREIALANGDAAREELEDMKATLWNSKREVAKLRKGARPCGEEEIGESSSSRTK